MRPIRVSVAATMGAILAIAGLLAMLRFPSPLLASALFSAVVLGLALTIIGVVFARGRTRAGWAGALIAGGLVWALHDVPWLERRFGDTLITVPIADILFERWVVPAPEPPEDEADGLASAFPASGTILLVRYGGFGDGFGGMGNGGIVDVPTATEVWTSVDHGTFPSPFNTSRRQGLGVLVVRRAYPAMQRIVDCLAVLTSAMIGAGFARRCVARAAPPTAGPPVV